MENRVLYQLGMALPLAIATIVGFTENNPVFAQLTPDNTLGAEGSIVTPQQLRDLIQGGAIRDGALFHSFDEFNVGSDRGVFFDLQNNTDILNIFTRVTGGNVSNILGTLGVLQDALNSDVLGNANLFLLNPNGITFGQNASLQLNGSFFATTADGFGFDGFTFSASGQEAPPPLLTVSIPRFLSFRDNPGDIVNQSIVPSTINPNVFDGLRVPDGQSLVLVGGDVNLQGGSLRAPGGRIEIGSLAEAGNVGINVDGNSISLSFPDGVTRGDVSLTALGNAIPVIDVTAGGGGDIAIYARNINILNGSAICAGIGADGDCGGLAPSQGSPGAQAGDILLNAQETITLANPVSFISNSVNSGAVGNSGNTNITTGSFVATESGQIVNSVFGGGVGDSGKVTINATDTVSFDGRDENDSFPSGIFTFINAGGEGNTGGIEINANTVRVTNRAQLLSTTIGIGDPGDIVINARDQVFLQNSIFISEVTEPNDDGTGGGVGNAGNIIITAGSLTLQDGSSLLADTENIGNAGDIIIDVRDEVILEGTGRTAFSRSTDIVQSQITSTVDSVDDELAIGEGGDISISAGSLLVTDGGFIRTSTFGQGNAGDLTINVDDSFTVTNGGFIAANDRDERDGTAGDLRINADSIFLNNSASLQATTQTGAQGNIILNAEGVILRRGSFISTDASGTSTGGNITINAGVLAGLENSDITANAQGQAGSITINSQGVFGLEVREGNITEEDPNQSEITAFSQQDPSLNGQIIFNTPETNPGSETIEPPEDVIDSSDIVTQSACYDFGGDSQLANTGRGGVPQIPGFIIRNDVVDVELVDEVLPAPPPEAIKPYHRTDVTFLDSNGEEFKPAMGAVLLPDGTVDFVDYNPAEVYRDMYAAAGCSRR